MLNTSDKWHFARPALAKSFVDKLFVSGISRVAFFGRRRIGKSEFMQFDLIPEAESRGAITMYCSMWGNKDRPYLVLLDALRELVNSDAKETKKKVTGKIGIPNVAEVGIELERATAPVPASASELQEITSLFMKLIKENAKKKRNCLLVLDEIQHLATSAKFSTFAATLRTMLDMAGDSVHVIFTGSSRADLDKLFNDNKAPFYQFANVMNFDPMSHDFVSHLETTYRDATKNVLPAHSLGRIFDETGRNAHITRALVERCIFRITRDIDAEWEDHKKTLTNDGGWCEKQWEDMSPIDRLVYQLVMNNKELFSEESLAIYTRSGHSRGTAQQGQARLINKGLITRVGHGNYVTEVPILDQWVKETLARPTRVTCKKCKAVPCICGSDSGGKPPKAVIRRGPK